MPQSTYMTLFTASYPILAKAQKPPGVTILFAVGAGDVPNKGGVGTPTIQVMLEDQSQLQLEGPPDESQVLSEEPREEEAPQGEAPSP